MRERDRLASGAARARSVPRCVQDLRDLKRIGDEGDDPHGLPALAAGQGIGFVDFQVTPRSGHREFAGVHEGIHARPAMRCAAAVC